MVLRTTRATMLACSAAAVLLAVPAQGWGCPLLDCLFGWARRCPPAYQTAYPTAVYAPVASTATSACPSQTCYYVPQTRYRTVSQCVPVTTLRPVTCCDPSTGCPVTTYRPVTVWTTQSRLVPYTTYRVVSAPCVSYAPLSTTVSAGSCCTAPPATEVPAGTIPSTSTPPATEIPKTFQNGQTPPVNGTTPTPDPNSDAASAGPQLFPDRTTSMPLQGTPRFRLISSPADPAPIHKLEAPQGGWRPSSP